MPNELTTGECAEILKNLSTQYVTHKQSEALNYAASIVRKYDRGEIVEVVRCKECRYCRTNSYSKMLYCAARPNANIITHDDFCSYGERKGGEK